MAELTYDSIFGMILDADPDERRVSVFTCDPKTLAHLMRGHDGEGRNLVEFPKYKDERYRIFGFPVLEKIGHDGLTFGPETE